MSTLQIIIIIGPPLLTCIGTKLIYYIVLSQWPPKCAVQFAEQSLMDSIVCDNLFILLYH